jgi:hypothetical protein
MHAGRGTLPDLYAATKPDRVNTIRTEIKNDSAGKNKGP